MGVKLADGVSYLNYSMICINYLSIKYKIDTFILRGPIHFLNRESGYGDSIHRCYVEKGAQVSPIYLC